MKPLVFVLLSIATALPVAHAEPTIFVVRHAEKAASADSKDPDLSPAGRERAAALATVLRDAQVKAIYATEFKRTHQTAEPAAGAAGLEITIVPAADTGRLLELLGKTTGNALVVGHSNTIPDLLRALGLPLTRPIADDDYDDLFVVTLGEPVRLLHLHYR